MDAIVPEPLGGAHTDHKGMAAELQRQLLRHLRELKKIPLASLLDRRYQEKKREWLPTLLVLGSYAGFCAAAILAQPDLGSVVVLGVIVMVLLFVEGFPLPWFAGLGAAAAAGVVALVLVLGLQVASAAALLDREWGWFAVAAALVAGARSSRPIRSSRPSASTTRAATPSSRSPTRVRTPQASRRARTAGSRKRETPYTWCLTPARSKAW